MTDKTVSACPYCESDTTGISKAWGMSPQGWNDMKEKHDAGHPTNTVSACPECKTPLVGDELEQFGCGMCGYLPGAVDPNPDTLKKLNSPTECPYCHTELLKGHSCPGAKEDCRKAVKELVAHTAPTVEKMRERILTDCTAWSVGYMAEKLDELLAQSVQEAKAEREAKVGEKKRIAYQLGYKEAQTDIGKSLREWYYNGTGDIEDVIEELTGVKK